MESLLPNFGFFFPYRFCPLDAEMDKEGRRGWLVSCGCGRKIDTCFLFLVLDREEQWWRGDEREEQGMEYGAYRCLFVTFCFFCTGACSHE